MAGYGAERSGLRGHQKKLHHITLTMPTAENGGKHVLEHHYTGGGPDRYEFQAAEGPAVVAHIEKSIGANDIGTAEGSDKSEIEGSKREVLAPGEYGRPH